MGNGATAKYTFDSIIGESQELLLCKEKALKASKTSSPVLIYGETGTGKELFAQSIHNSSTRKDKVFLAQNCAAIPINLLESILFGTVKGSFTGAEDKRGMFELADGGTLYLDELNSMPIELQGKILRVLQEDAVLRVGSTTQKQVDVRVVASLNEPPEDLVRQGKLRSDLFYRLNVVRISIPPLRVRKEDISLLVNHFINKFNERFNSSVEGINDSALEKLIMWNWEGNIRELEHVIEAMFNLGRNGTITAADLKEVGFGKGSRKLPSLKERLEEAERNYITEAVITAKYNITKAAELLGIPRQTLQSKIKRMNIRI
jgi:arginine utilization regulatory protein